jgi:very-short-patch-repair endonuclease
MTNGERLLWSRLRGELLGVKFRRQHPLGSYVADFACLEPKLIVEIDGSQHADQLTYDQKRDDFFRQQGFDVLRFPANLPFTALQSVAEVIINKLTELDAARAPIPAFPQRGKEQEELPELPLPPLGEGRGKVGMGAPRTPTSQANSRLPAKSPTINRQREST